MRTNVAAGLLALIAAAGLTTGMLLESSRPSQWAFITVGLLLPALGWLLAARRPEVRYGWLLLVTAVCFGIGMLGAGLLIRGVAGGYPLAAALALFYGLSWVFIPLLFPEGRLPSRRWRPVAWIAGVAIATHAVGNAMMTIMPTGYSDVSTPVGLVGTLASTIGQTVTWIMSLVVLGGLVVRWWRSERPERGQYGWILAGAVAVQAGIGLVLSFSMNAALPGIGMIGLCHPGHGPARRHCGGDRAAPPAGHPGANPGLASPAGVRCPPHRGRGAVPSRLRAGGDRRARGAARQAGHGGADRAGHPVGRRHARRRQAGGLRQGGRPGRPDAARARRAGAASSAAPGTGGASTRRTSGSWRRWPYPPGWPSRAPGWPRAWSTRRRPSGGGSSATSTTASSSSSSP